MTTVTTLPDSAVPLRVGVALLVAPPLRVGVLSLVEPVPPSVGADGAVLSSAILLLALVLLPAGSVLVMATALVAPAIGV